MTSSRIAGLLQDYYEQQPDSSESSDCSSPGLMDWRDGETAEQRLLRLTRSVNDLRAQNNSLAITKFEIITGPGLEALTRSVDRSAQPPLEAVDASWSRFYTPQLHDSLHALSAATGGVEISRCAKRLRELPGKLGRVVTLREAHVLKKLQVFWGGLDGCINDTASAVIAALKDARDVERFNELVNVASILLPGERLDELQNAAVDCQVRMAITALTFERSDFTQNCYALLTWAETQLSVSERNASKFFAADDFREKCEIHGVEKLLEESVLPNSIDEFERGVVILEESEICSAAIDVFWEVAAPAVLFEFIITQPLESLTKCLRVFREKALGARLEDLASSLLPRLCVEAVLFCADNLSLIHSLVQRASSRFQASDSLEAVDGFVENAITLIVEYASCEEVFPDKRGYCVFLMCLLKLSNSLSSSGRRQLTVLALSLHAAELPPATQHSVTDQRISTTLEDACRKLMASASDVKESTKFVSSAYERIFATSAIKFLGELALPADISNT